MTKRLTAAGMALLLSLAAGSAQPAYAEADGKEIAGVWRLSSLKNGEETLGPEEMAQREAAGILMYMVIEEDGTLTVSIDGERAEGVWDEDTITAEDSSLAYTLDGDALTLHQDEDYMVFSRTSMDTIYNILGYWDGMFDENAAYQEGDQAVMDTGECRVTITGYEADADGFRVKLTCSNDSDRTVDFVIGSTYLNRFLLDPVYLSSGYGVEAAPGESQDTELVYSVRDLERCGISAVDEFTISLQVIDAGDASALTEQETVTVYPTGKSAEEVVPAIHVPTENEQVLADNDTCRFSVQEAVHESVLGYLIAGSLENKSDTTLIYEWSGTAVNGVETDDVYMEELLPGTQAYTDILISNESMEEAGVAPEEVTEISFVLSAYEADGDEPVMEETVTIHP